MTMLDENKLNTLVGQLLNDLGGAHSITMGRIGDGLGLYDALHEAGPTTSEGLARRLKLDERYVREWLSHQAVSGWISYDARTRTFSLSPEQAMLFAEKDSPVYMPGAFDVIAAAAGNKDKVQAAFKTGEGVAWGNQGGSQGCMACAVARFFRPGYVNNLVSQWLPKLEGVVAKLEAGAKVADIGCGHGWSTVLMAQAFPNSRFVGYDFDEGSIEAARAHAREHGVSGNARFEVTRAKELPEKGFDFVTLFDALHDMGDPVGAAKSIRAALKPDGTMMVVEPMAGDRLEDNFNPVSRLYYAGSTLICVPTSKAQEVGAALGAQAGELLLGEVIGKAGFRTVRRAADTPFNMVIEARP
jgi:2-polyprenyl-3-methyl-5-hydroxy-6-metoxy-1,4-benzoquinol methylase